MTHQDFIKWLEGYLDATKNKLTQVQVREIRKKMDSIHSNTQIYPSYPTYPIYDPYQVTCTTGTTLTNNGFENETNNEEDSDFMEAINANKEASTLEDLK
jgi:hypothetical protein